jgi:nucleoside-diphosphate-sugar epimerase
MIKMKTLITGGTGFIGSRLALRCIERGDDVNVLAQINTPAEEFNTKFLQDQGVTLVKGGVTEVDKVEQAVKDCDIVFHLAAAQHEANVPDQHFWQVNVDGTKNVLEASIKAGVKRFVHGSTIGIYGVELEGQIDEDSPKKPDNIYGVTKKAGEELVLSYKEKIPVSVVRISETYGPGDRRLLKLFKGIAKKSFFVIGGGQNRHQLIYVDDLIDGMYLASEKEGALGEVFVLAGKEILTTDQMVDTVAKVLNVQKLKFRAPMWPFYVLAVIMEKTLRPLGIQPPLHRRRLDFFKKDLFFSHEKSERLLEFHPKTSFEEGAAATADWYKQNNLL